jgi:hypothetical protein
MHVGFQTMRTELKKMEAVLAKGNIPKPDTHQQMAERRDDYDRDTRYIDRERGFRGPPRGSHRGGGRGLSEYGGRGSSRGGYRH